MVGWRAAGLACLGALFLAGCSAATRHKVLSTFFDGVPPLESPDAGLGASPVGSAPTGRPRPIAGTVHGPFAAKLCSACHEAGATNALVVPGDELCFRCHDLRMDKPFVHGPLAAGGCLSCHDPHQSANAFLLKSSSDSFCLNCHDRDSLARTAAHTGAGDQCTSCHDAHMSDKKYLLK